MLCERTKCFISLGVAYRHNGFGSFIGEKNISCYLTSVIFVGNNGRTNKNSSWL